MPPPLPQHVVDGADAVCGGLDLHVVDGLHQAGSGHEEGGVAHAPGGGNQLPASSSQGLRSNLGIHDLVLDVADRLVTQRAFSCTPLEALDNGVLHGVQQALVHIRRQRVVDQDVRPLALRPEGPDGARRQEVPLVLLLEEGAHLLARPVDAHRAPLDILSKAPVERFRNHGEFVALVGSLRKTLQLAGLHHRLREADHRVRHLDLDFAVQLPQVLHEGI
mmetsp:Transcript_20010/g.60454  ORF Transcript_20010/g.60454 Transcript_20010/m.60454 type:complete len:220 (-) Transcript_20010:2220-2879(-)